MLLYWRPSIRFNADAWRAALRLLAERRLSEALAGMKSIMAHVLVFFVLIAGAIALYNLWGITHAIALLLLGFLVEGSAYWWASRTHDEESSK